MNIRIFPSLVFFATVSIVFHSCSELGGTGSDQNSTPNYRWCVNTGKEECSNESNLLVNAEVCASLFGGVLRETCPGTYKEKYTGPYTGYCYTAYDDWCGKYEEEETCRNDCGGEYSGGCGVPILNCGVEGYCFLGNECYEHSELMCNKYEGKFYSTESKCQENIIAYTGYCYTAYDNWCGKYYTEYECRNDCGGEYGGGCGVPILNCGVEGYCLLDNWCDESSEFMCNKYGGELYSTESKCQEKTIAYTGYCYTAYDDWCGTLHETEDECRNDCDYEYGGGCGVPVLNCN
ncbi:MAG: hypothetical protein FWC15_05680 [Fibromonadales bacterium]|nr:hypothetical protein [Fibromonadales bacterium]